MIYRDENSQALVNNDVAALNKYKMERNNYRKIENLGKELNEVKKTLARICEIIEKMESK